MGRTFSLVLMLLFLQNFTILFAQTNSDQNSNISPIYEKYMSQPEVWNIPKIDNGDVDISGHYTRQIPIETVSLPNGFSINVAFNYSSDIKYNPLC